MSEPDPYLLGYRPAEQERLERQGRELAHESSWLFDQIGVGREWQVVEIYEDRKAAGFDRSALIVATCGPGHRMTEVR